MSRTYVIPIGSIIVRDFKGIRSTYITEQRCSFIHQWFYHDEDKDFLILRWMAEENEVCVWYVPKDKDTLQVVTT